MSDTIRTLSVGDILPEAALEPAGGGAPVALRRQGRQSTVAIFLDDPTCAACSAWLGEVARVQDEIREWDGRVLAIVPAPEAGDVGVRSPFPTLLDLRGALATRIGVAAPAVVVADQWGEIYLARFVGPDHRFPPASDIVDWVRYLAVRCPECEGEAL